MREEKNPNNMIFLNKKGEIQEIREIFPHSELIGKLERPRANNTYILFALFVRLTRYLSSKFDAFQLRSRK